MRLILVVSGFALGCGPGPQPAPAEPVPIAVAPAPPAPAPADPGEGGGAIRAADPPATYVIRHTRPAIAVPPVDRSAPLFALPPPRAAAAAPGSPAVQAAAPVPDGQIRALRKLVDATGDADPEKPEFLLRLGEALASRDRHRPEAIKTLADLVDNPAFKSYARIDQALFQLGNLLAQAKRMPDARKAYLRLIKEYPASMFIPDVYLVFADYYFEQGQMADAGQFYDKVLQFPKAKVYGYAMYKRGWVAGNLGDWRRALELFYETARAAGTEPLVAAGARSGLVRAYAEMGKPDMAHKTFQRVSAGDADGMLEELVDVYEQAGKLVPAIHGYRELIRLRPADAKVCDWQLGVVRSARIGLSATEWANEAGRLADVADHVKTPACSEVARAVLVALGRGWHAEAQKTLNRETFPLAERMYARYLMSFAAGPEATAVRHHRAELLWEVAQMDRTVIGGRGKWPQVAAAYDEVAADPGATPELRAAAGEAARLARENLAAIP
jgi:tetratricopeptide (TPR) repeat protein